MGKFLDAIIAQEGYFVPGELGHVNGSISWRNKNPGNLRSSPFECGKRDGFSVFKYDSLGYMALQFDILQKAKGNTVTRLNGDSTILDFCEVYAPASDNNSPELYADFIYEATGFDKNFTLKELLSD